MKRIATFVALLALSLGGLMVRAQGQARGFVPVTDAMLQKPNPGDWLAWRRTPDGWGYSPLDQINRNNVSQIRMVWTHPLGPGQSEGTPLVHDGVMYVPSAGDYIFAADAKTGDMLWEYKRKLPEGVNPKRTRTLAIWGNLIINSSSDNYIYALNAQTGQLVWETPVLDPRKRAPTTGGPIIANGKVITGRQCQPDAGRDSCVVTAHDARTGKEVWRFHTIPGPGEPNFESWGDVPMEQRWHVGTWMVPSYDPELNLIYVGTSVTIPAPKFIARRQRQEAPLSQLHARLECRHGQDRLVLPARRRSLGSGSSLRAAARRYRRRSQSTRRLVDQPEREARSAAQSGHRHSRENRNRLHAGSSNR